MTRILSHRIDHPRKRCISEVSFDRELLGPLPKLNLAGIDWVIVGGESGPGARPMDPAWVLAIRNQCKETGVPFFFKQWGGTMKKQAGRMLEGKNWDEMPERSNKEMGGGAAKKLGVSH